MDQSAADSRQYIDTPMKNSAVVWHTRSATTSWSFVNLNQSCWAVDFSATWLDKKMAWIEKMPTSLMECGVRLRWRIVEVRNPRYWEAFLCTLQFSHFRCSSRFEVAIRIYCQLRRPNKDPKQMAWLSIMSTRKCPGSCSTTSQLRRRRPERRLLEQF